MPENLILCDDCTMIFANGVDDPTDPATIEHIHAMLRTTADWSGSVVVGEPASDFSTIPCDTCDSTLAGARHNGALLPR